MRKVAVLFVILSGVSGCATDDTQYVRDGVQYGVTEGVFRGRWWNYYERGRSFQEGRFLDEAERDLRVALDQRPTDQRWARTYGLRFLREYFPHRELGVTLYLQGRYEDAIAELTTSLDQIYTARAAFYLNEARAGFVAENQLDSAPPSVALLDPKPGATLFGRRQTARVQLADDTFVRGLVINGERVPLDIAAPQLETSWPVTLEPGANAIVVRVEDIVGNVIEERFELAADFDGPAISFDDPTVAGRVQGAVYDPSGVARLTVAGVEVGLVTSADGVARFDQPLPATDAPLTYVATDTLGNETRGEIGANGATGVARHDTRARIRIAANGPVSADTFVVAQASTADPLDFFNVVPNGRYLLDEIVVGLDIRAASDIERLLLNGLPVTGLIPGRKNQRVMRRVPLEGPGSHLIVAELQQAQRETAVEQVTIQRELTEAEAPDQRLGVALLGNVWDQENVANPEEAEFVSDTLAQRLTERGRFRVLSRDLLPEILSEQELIGALGSREQRRVLGEVVQADIFVVGQLRRDPVSLEIVLQAVNTETSEVMTYLDAAGPADSPDDVEQLVDDLALLLEQFFPRVQGQIAALASGNRAYSTLSESDRIRSTMKTIVFREGEEIVVGGVSLGRPQEVVTEAVVTNVQEQLSTLQWAGDPTVQVDDRVVTK